MKFSKLVETVSKKPIPPHVKTLIAEVMVTDAQDEDVDVNPCSSYGIEYNADVKFSGAVCCYSHLEAAESVPFGCLRSLTDTIPKSDVLEPHHDFAPYKNK
jgi:hypothetical protein